MLSYIQQGFWRFVSRAERDALTGRLERVLRDGLDRAATPSVKSAWFSTLRDTARTPPTLAWLEGIWRKSESVPGLTLAEPDYIQLAQELAVRGVPAWETILAEQFTRIENPDRKARFAFVRPALSSDQSTRDGFFAEPEATCRIDATNPGCWRDYRICTIRYARKARSTTFRASLDDARGHTADRRHLLSEALDGRDALGPQLRERRAHGEIVSRGASADLPGQATACRPVFG